MGKEVPAPAETPGDEGPSELELLNSPQDQAGFCTRPLTVRGRTHFPVWSRTLSCVADNTTSLHKHLRTVDGKEKRAPCEPLVCPRLSSGMTLGLPVVATGRGSFLQGDPRRGE